MKSFSWVGFFLLGFGPIPLGHAQEEGKKILSDAQEEDLTKKNLEELMNLDVTIASKDLELIEEQTKRMAKLVAQELRGQVVVAVLHPGFCRTDMTSKYSDEDDAGVVRVLQPHQIVRRGLAEPAAALQKGVAR